MSRPVILSNGQMMVGLDESGLVHDFYYPYIGLENLTTARSIHHKIGVWVDGKLSWIDGEDWDKSVDFSSEALYSIITLKNEKLGIELVCNDFVDTEFNAFIRQITVRNLNDSPKEVRVFMHQVFQISHEGRADTALYVPKKHYLQTYKGRTHLLIYGRIEDGSPFDQYAVGNYGIEGKAGTYYDAEDGELSGNPVEHGGVDSTIRITAHINANETKKLHYWIIASSNQVDAEKVHELYMDQGINHRFAVLKHGWGEWLKNASDGLGQVNTKYINLVKKSLLIIKAHQDKRGGVLASGDSSIFNYGRDYYCYCWPRDGAYAMWPLIRLGYTLEPRAFFEFCRDTLSPDGYLMHKYQPDKAVGSTWHPLIRNGKPELAIQEDETASVISMLGEYFQSSGDEEFTRSMFEPLIKPAADFMANFIDEETNLPHASYDLWEEKFLTTTYTAFAVISALKTAATFAEKFDYAESAAKWSDTAERIQGALSLLFNADGQYYRKGLVLKPDGSLQFDNVIDASSLYGSMMFGSGKIGDASVAGTAKAVQDNLKSSEPAGGYIRYTHDRYMATSEHSPGNPWFVCSLWYAQYQILIGNHDIAQEIVDSSMELALSSGMFSEQFDPQTGAPLGVAPLVWSHAEFINTVLDLSKK